MQTSFLVMEKSHLSQAGWGWHSCVDVTGTPGEINWDLRVRWCDVSLIISWFGGFLSRLWREHASLGESPRRVMGHQASILLSNGSGRKFFVPYSQLFCYLRLFKQKNFFFNLHFLRSTIKWNLKLWQAAGSTAFFLICRLWSFDGRIVALGVTACFLWFFALSQRIEFTLPPKSAKT